MFIDNKYTKIYYRIINNAILANRLKLKPNNINYIYYEKHHIIPKTLGGTNDVNNIVLLTGKEHYIVHLLLCKMTSSTNKHKMINALIKLSFAKSNGQMRYTSRSYNLTRKFIAIKNSETMKGKPKSNQMRERLSLSRKGMKFTEKHKYNLSLSKQNTNIGAQNPFYGKSHSEETKIKWSKQRKGKSTIGSTGMKWFNNGLERGMFLPHEIPNGWVPGKKI